jgi:hypothetical protein
MQNEIEHLKAVTNHLIRLIPNSPIQTKSHDGMAYDVRQEADKLILSCQEALKYGSREELCKLEEEASDLIAEYQQIIEGLNEKN